MNTATKPRIGFRPLHSLWLFVFALAACSSPTDLDRLEFELEVSEPIVAARDFFEVTLRISNPTARDIEIHTSTGCISEPTIRRGSTFYPWVGTELLCTQAPTSHLVPAGGAIVTVFELQAVLLVNDITIDPEPGTYLVGMSLFPELATPLQVSPKAGSPFAVHRSQPWKITTPLPGKLFQVDILPELPHCRVECLPETTTTDPSVWSSCRARWTC